MLVHTKQTKKCLELGLSLKKYVGLVKTTIKHIFIRKHILFA